MWQSTSRAMPGDELNTPGKDSPCQGNPGSGSRRTGRTDTWDDFEFNASKSQAYYFFFEATKDPRIAGFKPHHMATPVCMFHQQSVYVFLTVRWTPGPFTDIDLRSAGTDTVENGTGGQIVE